MTKSLINPEKEMKVFSKKDRDEAFVKSCVNALLETIYGVNIDGVDKEAISIKLDFTKEEFDTVVDGNLKINMDTEKSCSKTPFPIIYLYGTFKNKDNPFEYGILILHRETYINDIKKFLLREDGWDEERDKITPITDYTETLLYSKILKNEEQLTLTPILFFARLCIEKTENSYGEEIIYIDFPQVINNDAVDSNARMVSTITTYFFKLLNCKNIILKEETNGRKHNNKKYENNLNYAIHIVAPGKRVITLGEKQYESIPFADREKLNVGQKRGHFKTFTPEKPLFGRHVGTWWWAPVFNVKNIRDYEIHHKKINIKTDLLPFKG